VDLSRPGRTYDRPDLAALVEIVSRMSAGFCAQRGDVVELEVNPLTWASGGWRAVDALLRRAP
jgi:hypothetical protein